MIEDADARKLKLLLKAAEKQIVYLRGQLDDYIRGYQDLMESQKAEAEQLVQLTEQIWALEEALAASVEEKDEALGLVRTLRESMGHVQQHLQEALDAASRNASRLEMAARVYEVARLAEPRTSDKFDEGWRERHEILRNKARGKT